MAIKNISVIKGEQKKIWHQDGYGWHYGYDFELVQNGRVIYSGTGSESDIMAAVNSFKYSETDAKDTSEWDMAWH